MTVDQANPLLMDTSQFAELLAFLGQDGYQVLGPVLKGGGLAYGPISGLEDLPVGWQEEMAGGSYRLGQSHDGLFFSGHLGSDSVKRLFYPPELELFQAAKGEDGWRFNAPDDYGPPLAVVGLRPCELAALKTLDQVFTQGPFADAHYQDRRQSAFLVVVNCGRSGNNCFCGLGGHRPPG